YILGRVYRCGARRSGDLLIRRASGEGGRPVSREPRDARWPPPACEGAPRSTARRRNDEGTQFPVPLHPSPCRPHKRKTLAGPRRAALTAVARGYRQ
ncbi:Hypothetical predicted protein, partial [Pelobates cultripes]